MTYTVSVADSYLLIIQKKSVVFLCLRFTFGTSEFYMVKTIPEKKGKKYENVALVNFKNVNSLTTHIRICITISIPTLSKIV